MERSHFSLLASYPRQIVRWWSPRMLDQVTHGAFKLYMLSEVNFLGQKSGVCLLFDTSYRMSGRSSYCQKNRRSPTTAKNQKLLLHFVSQRQLLRLFYGWWEYRDEKTAKQCEHASPWKASHLWQHSLHPSLNHCQDICKQKWGQVNT